MKNRSNFVLLFLFFAALAGLWAADQWKLPTRKDRERAEPRILPELLDAKSDDVQRIEIAGGAKKIVFERSDRNKWQMREPVDTAADPGMVEALAFTLKELTKQRDVGHLEGSLESFGLEKPERTISVFGKDAGKPIASLDLGKTAQGMRYVKSKSSEFVEVVDPKPLASADLAPARWRDRMLVRMPSHIVSTLEITRGKEKFKAEREGELWHVTEPYRFLGDAMRVDGAVSEVVSARVAEDVGFVADNVTDFAKYGLAPPVAKFEVKTTSKDGKEEVQSYEIGKAVEGGQTSRIYARRSDQDEVVAVEGKLLAGVGTNVLDLHSKKLADFKADRVTYFRVKTGDSTVAIRKRGEGWQRVIPLVDRADKSQVDDLLKKLDEAEASTIFAPGKAPDPQLDKPWAVVEIWHETAFDSEGNPKSPPRTAIKVGRRDALNKIAICQTESDPAIMSVPLPFVKDLPSGPLAFRDRIIASTPGPEVDHIDIKVGDTARSLQAPEKPDPNGWRMKQPIDARADSESIGRLIFVLSNLRADALVAEKADVPGADFGFDAPYLIATWVTRSKSPEPPMRIVEPVKTTLTVGKALRDKTGKRYAKISSSPIVFTLAPEIVETFNSEWRDRHVLTFDPTKVEKVVIGWPAIALSFRPIADASSKTHEPQWAVIDPPAGLNFDPSRLKTLVKALSRLQTFRFTQYSGPIKPEEQLFPPRLRIDVHMTDGTMSRFSLGKQTSDGYLQATTMLDKSGPVFQLPLSGWQPWIVPPKIETAAPKPAEAPAAKPAEAPKPADAPTPKPAATPAAKPAETPATKPAEAKK